MLHNSGTENAHFSGTFEFTLVFFSGLRVAQYTFLRSA